MTTIMTEGSLLAVKFPTRFLYKPEKYPSSRSPGILLNPGDVVMLLPLKPYSLGGVWHVRPSFLYDEKPIYYTHSVSRNDLRATMKTMYVSLYSMFTVVDEDYIPPVSTSSMFGVPGAKKIDFTIVKPAS